MIHDRKPIARQLPDGRWWLRHPGRPGRSAIGYTLEQAYGYFYFLLLHEVEEFPGTPPKPFGQFSLTSPKITQE